IEKAYRDWAHDIGPDDNPLQAGLAFTCAWDKPGGFIGREALLKLKDSVPDRRLVQFLLMDSEPMLYHNEPIFRDGELVGHTTSGTFGPTLGASVALGYVGTPSGASDDYIASGRYEIQVSSHRIPARASLKPFFDPTSSRIRR